MISARPPNAPTGRPPPMILPSVVRSGRMPSRSCAPPGATRKPVMTSSKIRSAPWRFVSSRRPARKPGLGSTSPMLPAYGSTMTPRSQPGSAAKRGAHRVEIVVRQRRACRARCRPVMPGESGDAVRQRAAAGRDQERVAVAVIAARELDQLVASGEAAREPQRAHRRFGAARTKANRLDRRNHRADELGEFAFGFGRRAVRRTACGCGLHGFDDGGMRVAENERPPRHDVVDVGVAVEIGERCSPAPTSRTAAFRRPP